METLAEKDKRIEELEMNLSILQDLANLKDEEVFRRELLLLMKRIAEALESISIPSEEEETKKK